MSDGPVPDHIVDRLRTNLRGAGIPFTDADLAGMVEKGFVQRVVLFEQMAPRYPSDGVPDYLAARAANPGAVGDRRWITYSIKSPRRRRRPRAGKYGRPRLTLAPSTPGTEVASNEKN